VSNQCFAHLSRLFPLFKLSALYPLKGTLDCENLFVHNGESIEKVIDVSSLTVLPSRLPIARSLGPRPLFANVAQRNFA
jgi:hypothetical protein